MAQPLAATIACCHRKAMKVLALNCGSSSIKAALIDTARQLRVLDVRVQNLGKPDAILRVGDHSEALGQHGSQAEALQRIFATVREHCTAVHAIGAIAHRVVHGGTEFGEPTLLDDTTVDKLQQLAALAPLHNPPAMAAVAAARLAFPDVPQVAVFDTAFHATLPRRSREYALPVDLTCRLGLRRFGFHGISHAHVAAVAADYMQVPTVAQRVISCHLGNGASITAIEYGRSVETSMGMTPLEGLVMGTRAGDIDPGVLLQLLESGEFDRTSLGRLLNEASGLKGLTGTEDMSDIERRAADGDEGCRLAIAVFAHRARKYIGAYAATMGGVEAIAFTGGIGENSPLIRHRIAQRLDFLGAVIDEDRNRDAHLSESTPVIDIATERSRVRILVVRADEEAAMANAVAGLLQADASAKKTFTLPVAISARHAHLSQKTIDVVFGAGQALTLARPLSQPGQFAARETVTLIGPRGQLEQVRVLGPPRAVDQVEISRSDEFILGIDAPVRLSGDTANTPGIIVAGPAGRVALQSGVICAHRHIHMHPDDAVRLQLKDRDRVEVRIDSAGRSLTFGDVIVRVSTEFRLEMHIDVDEANAAGLDPGASGEVLLPTSAIAHATAR
ncbi:MAG: acetate/propionate family kinase [Steroidobacteraceae bacterium]